MKSILLLALGIMLFSGCASTYNMYVADKRVQSLAIGMERDEVIRIMGESYIVNSASKDAEGNLVEVLAYRSASDEEYRLNFTKGRLESWNRVHLREYIKPEAIQTAPVQN